MVPWRRSLHDELIERSLIAARLLHSDAIYTPEGTWRLDEVTGEQLPFGGTFHMGGSSDLVTPSIDAALRTLSELWIRSGRKSHTLLKTIGFRSSVIEAAASGRSSGYQIPLEPLLLIIGLSFLFLAADVAFGSALAGWLFPNAPEAAPSNPYSHAPTKKRSDAEDGTAETRRRAEEREAEERAAEWDRFKRERWGLLVFNMLLGFASEFLLWMLAPFFPSEALGRGVSREIVGLVFACQPLALAVSSQLTPMLLRQLEPFVLLQRSLFMQAAIIAGFGLAGGIRTAEAFAACAASNRLMLGVISGLNEPTAQAVTFRLVPSHSVTYAVGLVIGSRFAAMVAGPVGGGLLYSFGGFPLPFLVASAIFLLLGCVAFYVGAATPLRPLQPAHAAVYPARLLRYPAVCLVLCCTLLLWFAIMFLEPLYEPVLSAAPYNLDVESVGLVLSSGAAAMVVALLFAAHVLAGRIAGLTQHTIGFVILIMALPFLGPFPPLQLQRSVGLFVSALCSVYLGAGLIGPTQSGLILNVLSRAGLSQQEVAGALASLNIAVSTVGSLLGPLAAGAIVPALTNFRIVTTLLAAFMALGLVPNVLLLLGCVGGMPRSALCCRLAREGDGGGTCCRCCTPQDEERQQELQEKGK